MLYYCMLACEGDHCRCGQQRSATPEKRKQRRRSNTGNDILAGLTGGATDLDVYNKTVWEMENADW